MIASLFFVIVTGVFLFELNYGWIIPVILIAAGLLLLFRPFFGQTPH